MSESQTPLARHVLFMVCLSIAGTIVAGAHYYAIDLPQQLDVQAPNNFSDSCQQWIDKCLLYCKSSSNPWCESGCYNSTTPSPECGGFDPSFPQ